MAIYIKPIDDSYLNLTGGTVSGNTVFLNNLSASTIYSGNTELGEVIENSIKDNVYDKFLPLSGGSGGEYNFTGVTSAETINVSGDIIPKQDNYSNIGTRFKRFRSLNTVNGVAVYFTASTKITTITLQLGNRELTENNVIITGDTVVGGHW